MPLSPLEKLKYELNNIIHYIKENEFFVPEYDITISYDNKKKVIILTLSKLEVEYASIILYFMNEYIDKNEIRIHYIHSKGNQVGKLLFFVILYCIVKSNCVNKISLLNHTDDPVRASLGIYKDFEQIDEEEMVYTLHSKSLMIDRINLFKTINPNGEPWSDTIDIKLKKFIHYLNKMN